MRYTFDIAGPPPTRLDAGRCADRNCPEARPLFERARRVVAESRDSFPIGRHVDVLVTSRVSLPEPAGYGPADAMIEVLVDAGVLADERLVYSERYLIDPDLPGYSITLEPRT